MEYPPVARVLQAPHISPQMHPNIQIQTEALPSLSPAEAKMSAEAKVSILPSGIESLPVIGERTARTPRSRNARL